MHLEFYKLALCSVTSQQSGHAGFVLGKGLTKKYIFKLHTLAC